MHTVTETLTFQPGVTGQQTYLAKVDAAEALARYNAGESYRQIAATMPGVSYGAVFRAVRRAIRAGGVARKESHEPPRA